MNWTLMRCLHVLGTSFEVKMNPHIPVNVPLIIVSNHQSMWEISPIVWFLRKHHPKFISKIELGKGIPSVSFNLKYGGSALIDRKNPRQAISEMIKFSRYLVRFNRSGVIFPEGTRSFTGAPKPFQRKGLVTLFKNAPEAFVLPITINHSWKLQKFGMFPMPLGVKLNFLIHPTIKVSEHTADVLIDIIETKIKAALI